MFVNNVQRFIGLVLILLYNWVIISYIRDIMSVIGMLAFIRERTTFNKNSYFSKKMTMAFEAINIQDVAGSQMIKIPDNFKIDDDKVYLKKVGNTIYIIPFHNPWQSMVDSLNKFSDDFMEDRHQPSQQSREFFD